MTKTYRIEVDCANCANRMEREILKIEGVESASVHFFTSKLTTALGMSGNLPIFLAVCGPSIIMIFISASVLLHSEDG